MRFIVMFVTAVYVLRPKKRIFMKLFANLGKHQRNKKNRQIKVTAELKKITDKLTSENFACMMRKICAEKLRHTCWGSYGLRKCECNND